jgi:TP901 family phage tail tape measure protein
LAKNKEYELAIKIAGEVEKSFLNSTKLSKKELQELARTATQTSSSVHNSFNSGMSNVSGGFDAISSAAKKAFDFTAKAALTAATAIAGLATASIAVGSGFESAFAGVKKTVNATDAEFDELETSIRDMAKNMPMTAEEIAGIAEAAGQLGIETDNIASFTKTMADLSVATNLTSQDAATEFARFANITGMSQDNFERLGSSVVALGNNMATTESEITEMAMRLAGAGSQVDMSESQIMGFAAALSSVGIEAEAGGSAFSKVMVDMQLAVESGKNGLKDYAKVAGMTTTEFQKAFKEDAAGAMIEFITGLNNVKRNGKSAISVLD